MSTRKFASIPAGDIRLQGELGRMTDLVVANRLNQADYPMMVDVFRKREERDGAWRSEFWGKVVRSAILAWYATGDETLLGKIKETVRDILTTQTEDGCISSYPEDLQLSSWDIWGRKYVLAGLTRYLEFVEKDPEVLTACERLMDHFMTKVGPGIRHIASCGRHDGLAACSILYVVVHLYKLSGKQKYLDYAKWIAGTGCSLIMNIYEAARNGVHPEDIPNGKSYEMMSCYLGLCELYEVDPQPEYLETVKRFYEMVRDYELFITGVSGLKDTSGEFWYNGKFKQCMTDVGAHGETCVTTTWIQFCEIVFRNTGDLTIMDEMERALYNGILGAIKPDGSTCVHMNPDLMGVERAWKQPAPDQIYNVFKTPFDGNDCCRAQAPEAIAQATPAAAFVEGDTLSLMLYDDMTIRFKSAKITVSGGYPFRSEVKIRINLPAPETFTLALRVPSWQNPDAGIDVCGEKFAALPGTCCNVTREWQDGDVITILFDLSPVCVKDPGESGRITWMCGPVVMAQDSRLSGEIDVPVKEGTLTVAEDRPGFRMLRKTEDGTLLCDYASAGSEFDENNKICVWMRTK